MTKPDRGEEGTGEVGRDETDRGIIGRLEGVSRRVVGHCDNDRSCAQKYSARFRRGTDRQMVYRSVY